MKKPKRVLHYSNKVYESDRKRDTKMQPKKKEERNKNERTKKKGKKENETETRRSLIPIFLS